MKEARVARGFCSIVVSIRSDKATGRGKGESSGGKNVSSGKTGRGKVEGDRKLLGRSSTLVAAAGRGKAGDALDQFVMVHRIHKFVSCAVRRIIGHVIVRRWMVLQIRKSETLELTPMVRGLAIFLTIPVLNIVRISWTTRCVWIFCEVLQLLLSKMRMSVRLMLQSCGSRRFWCAGLWCNHLVWKRRRCRGSVLQG